MAPDTFLDRPGEPVPTTAGDVRVPVLYRDGSALFAYFQVEPARVEEVLAGGPLVPARFGRDAALAVIATFDLRDTSVGPYRQVATGVAVVPRDVPAPRLPLLHLLRARTHADVGLHILDLPVTSAIAEASGREIWGLPKFLTAIDLSPSPGGRPICAVVEAPEGEEPILVLEGRAGPGIALGALDLVLYTIRGGALFRSVLESRGWMRTSFGRGLALRLGDVEHPMARRLLQLGLGGARPVAVQVCRHHRAVVNAPAPFTAGIAQAA